MTTNDVAVTNVAGRTDAVKGSRLPAGSTLEIAPGVHVPHPHAEVNLAGAGDPRLGETDAVTEYVKSSKVPGHNGDGTLIDPNLEQKPLAEEVRPRRLTVATNTRKLPEVVEVHQITGAAAPSADLDLREDPASPADAVVELESK